MSHRLAAVAVLSALSLAAAAPAGAVAAAAKKPASRTITLKVTSKLEHAAGVDNAPAGDSPGDVLLFTEQLFDSAGKQVGTDAATCVRLFDARSSCTGTYIFSAGQIMVQLIQPGPTGTYRQAIVGGTGRYAGARGTVTVAQQQGGDHFTFSITLT